MQKRIKKNTEILLEAVNKNMQIESVLCSRLVARTALGWGVQHEINDKEHNYHGFVSIKCSLASSQASVAYARCTILSELNIRIYFERCSAATIGNNPWNSVPF